MHQIRFRPGLRPRPRWGSLQLTEGEWEGKGAGEGGWGGEGRGRKGGKGKEGREGKGRRGEGRGREYRHFFLYTLRTAHRHRVPDTGRGQSNLY